MHVRRDARSAQEIVTLRASPSSVQESAQEIPVVRNLETLGNCPLSCCDVILIFFVGGHFYKILHVRLPQSEEDSEKVTVRS